MSEPSRAILPPTLPEPIDTSSKGGTRRIATTGFADLPRGALIHQRFEVLEVLEITPRLNTYRALDETAARECLLFESDDAQNYQAEKRLWQTGLCHPALVEIYEVCWMRFGDHTRAYLATEYPLLPVTAGNVRAMTILQWGAQLADALANLHAQRLTHNDIRIEHLYVSNYQIKLGGFAHVSDFSDEGAAQDIAQLARTLQELALSPNRDAPAFAPVVNDLLARAQEGKYRQARAFQVDLQQALDELRHPSKLTTLVGRLSDVGLRREIDEDALLTTEIVQFTQTGYRLIGLYAVADGMGGASAGEVASRIVTDALARHVTRNIHARQFATAPRKLDYAELLRAAIEHANAEVLEARTRAHTDMGSTVVAALIVGNRAHIANVGDSRAYLIAGERITKLTKDHSLAQALADGGAISEEDARTHPQRNYILRNVGDKPEIAVDLFQIQIEPGQSLLLCCDGLWEMVRDEEICAIVARQSNPQDACRELIRVANQNGGDDNITCVLVRFEGA